MSRFEKCINIFVIMECLIDFIEFSSETKGSKLLQKMGWREGTGLGKTGQGIVNPIEAGDVRENRNAGLGAKTAKATPRSGDAYKQKIRQMTQDRWNDSGHGF